MLPPPLASQLAAAGLRVFPCRADKFPAVNKGESWKDYADRPPATSNWPSPLIGVVIDFGVVVIDLDTYKGLTRETVEAAIGCALPWDAALIQTTPRGGQHYAFRSPAWPVKFGSDLCGLEGFDFRTDSKGYICAGPAYAPGGAMGLFALAHPETLPVLPDGARAALERVAPPPPDRVALPVADEDLATLQAALSTIDPGGTRAEWVKIMQALRHQYAADPDKGFALFDAWSAGELWPGGCPENYDPDTQTQQWGSVKPDGGVTVASLFYEATRSGWIPPPTLDASGAFGPGAAAAGSMRALVDKILEHGSDPRQTQDLVAAVEGLACSALQRGVLLATLDRELKEAGLLTPGLRQTLHQAAGGPPRAAAPPLAAGAVLPPDQAIPPIMWHPGHTKGKELRPKGTLANFRIMLDAYGIDVAWDVIGKQILVSGAGIPEKGGLAGEAMLAHMDSLANLNEYPRQIVSGNLIAEALSNEINPVIDWVRAHPWDGYDHVGALFNCLTLHPSENPAVAEMLFRNWFRGAVAIGTGATDKFEFVLTFVDPEGGAGKTRFFTTLCPAPLRKHSLTLDTQSKDSVKTAISNWLVELGELDGTFSRSDQARLKSFLSEEEDEMRPPYGRAHQKYPRRTAFFASVNLSSFLVDGSNNRRFWPVRVATADHLHGVNVQQAWAQADVEVAAGQIWHLSPDEAAAIAGHNEEFRVNSQAVDLLAGAYLIGHEATEHKTVTACLRDAGMQNPHKSDLNEAARWLRSQGYVEAKRAGVRGFMVPPLALPGAGVSGAFSAANVVPLHDNK